MNYFHVCAVLCHLESLPVGPTFSMLTTLRMCRNAVLIPRLQMLGFMILVWTINVHIQHLRISSMLQYQI